MAKDGNNNFPRGKFSYIRISFGLKQKVNNLSYISKEKDNTLLKLISRSLEWGSLTLKW